MDALSSRIRKRASASPAVGLEGYVRVLAKWTKHHQGKTFEDLLGPVLLKEQRSVSASHIVRISGLLHVLLDEGCVNAKSIYIEIRISRQANVGGVEHGTSVQAP